MPYIKRQKKEDFIIKSSNVPTNQSINLLELVGSNCECAGDLNYCFTKIIQEYVHKKGRNYQHYNDAVGALENCKLELYRRAISIYEDLKIAENGDA